MTNHGPAINQIYNVACGEATSLRDLHREIRAVFQRVATAPKMKPPLHRPFRNGDVRHSLASTAKARRLLGYRPTVFIREGLDETVHKAVTCCR